MSRKSEDINLRNIIIEEDCVNNDNLKDRKSVWFNIFLFYVIIALFMYIYINILNHIDNSLIRIFFTIIYFLLINVLSISYYISFINLELFNFNISLYDMFNLFRHKKRKRLIPQYIFTISASSLIAALGFLPLLYIIFTLYGFDSFDYSLMNMYKDKLYYTIPLVILGFFVYNLIKHSLLIYYYTSYYNSLIKEFSGYWWNLKGSIKLFFNTRYESIRIVVLELLMSTLMVLVPLGLVYITVDYTKDMDALKLISFTNIARIFILFTFFIIDIVRFKVINTLIAKIIDKDDFCQEYNYK